MSEEPQVQNRSAFPPPPELFKLYKSARGHGMQEEALWVPPKPLEGQTFLKFGKPHSNEHWVYDLGSDVEKLFEGEGDALGTL